MSRLIETIRIIDGHAENLSWHNNRLNSSRLDLFGIQKKTDLGKLIVVPAEFCKGEVKCRVSYSDEIGFIEFEKYTFRTVKSLKIVISDSINYKYKYTDRYSLNALFSQKADMDDIIIIKNGFVTDSFYANIVFYDGKNYITPSTPLLLGTKRAKYLSEGRIKEKAIKREDIELFKEVHLINAFLDLGRCVIPASRIQ